VNCPNVVNVLQRCQARLLSAEGQRPLSSPDKSQSDIPGSSQSNNTTRNILIGIGAVAIGAAVYYVSFAQILHLAF